ncbi:MAG TPA: DUF2948 family protein [Stellaceae bacterium]|jgi:hypothetical protein
MAAEPAGDGALKLRAEDDEDLAVISAILQDALVAVSDMAYISEDRRFVLMASRLMREGAGAGLERIRSGVRFDDVSSVQRQRFNPRDTERILVLLAVRRDRDGALRIDFAGGAGVRLEVGRILCHLEDRGEPWPTRQEPRHQV